MWRGSASGLAALPDSPILSPISKTKSYSGKEHKVGFAAAGAGSYRSLRGERGEPTFSLSRIRAGGDEKDGRRSNLASPNPSPLTSPVPLSASTSGSTSSSVSRSLFAGARTSGSAGTPGTTRDLSQAGSFSIADLKARGILPSTPADRKR